MDWTSLCNSESASARQPQYPGANCVPSVGPPFPAHVSRRRTCTHRRQTFARQIDIQLHPGAFRMLHITHGVARVSPLNGLEMDRSQTATASLCRARLKFPF